MTEAEAEGSPSRPIEANLTIGCLILLGLQQLHEGCLYLYGRPSLGLNNLHDAWLILLILFAGLAVGLWNRSRAAWWLAVVLVGMIAVIHVSQSLEVIRPSYGSRQRLTAAIDCGWRPTDDPFPRYWLMVENVLLAAVPSLSLLGRIRHSLAPSTP